MNDFDMGPDLTNPELDEPDRSVLLHCLSLKSTMMDPVDGMRSWAVEFGVGTGSSLRLIADYMPVIGFDSFTGLPEDWRPGFQKGYFTVPLPPTVAGATIVVGLFEDTAPGYDWPQRLAMVHFDADLYSSTITALNAIGYAIKPGCILVFDEFHGYDDDFNGSMPGEQQAFWEWATERGAFWEVIGHGREQWAIRILGFTPEEEVQ